MKILNSRRASIALAFLMLTALVVGAATFGSPRINASLSGTVARQGQNVPLEEAGKVNPREVITWNITASNVGDAPATSVSMVGDVDDATSFVPGSVAGSGVASVRYSTEHPHEYQTFSERPMVRYTEGGVQKERPASPEEYRAVQITFASIGAGKTLTASYRTRVR